MIKQFENIDFERIVIKVENAGDTVQVQHTTKFGHKELLGAALLTTDEDGLTGSRMRLMVDAIEVFSSDFEPRLIYAGKDCPVGQRFYPYLNRNIDQSPVEVTYVDNSNASAYPYFVHLHLVTNPMK